MKIHQVLLSGLVIVVTVSCLWISDGGVSDGGMRPSEQINHLIESGRYWEAIRLWPAAEAEWAQDAPKGDAAGWLLHYLFINVSGVGDSQWGKILDDPEIDMDTKLFLIKWIVEIRLNVAVFVDPETDVMRIDPSRKAYELNDESQPDTECMSTPSL